MSIWVILTIYCYTKEAGLVNSAIWSNIICMTAERQIFHSLYSEIGASSSRDETVA